MVQAFEKERGEQLGKKTPEANLETGGDARSGVDRSGGAGGRE